MALKRISLLALLVCAFITVIAADEEILKENAAEVVDDVANEDEGAEDSAADGGEEADRRSADENREEGANDDGGDSAVNKNAEAADEEGAAEEAEKTPEQDAEF